jgi:hypothetical protein
MNPRVWRAIAIGLSVVNVAGVVQALVAGEPMHAAGHVVAGLALAAWLRRLNERVRDQRGDRLVGGDQQAQIEGLENEMDQLRRELTEAQERLDFAERMLAKRDRPAPPPLHPSPPSGSPAR